MIDVRYVDNHLLVVLKPAGTLSQGDQTGDADLLTLAKAWVKEEYNKPGAVYLGLIHRLDRPASGLMVFARTSKAAARLTDQFKRRHVTKTYLALVEGSPPDTGSWSDWISKESGRPALVDRSDAGAKQAELSFERIAQFGSTSLVSITLKTGRPHQIRLQFSSRGFPLVGDLRYGAKKELDGRNLALHAAVLGVDHPTRGERLTWTEMPPETWPEGARKASRAWLSAIC